MAELIPMEEQPRILPAAPAAVVPMTPPEASERVRAVSLAAHPAFETDYGYRFHNPVHGLDAHLRVDRVSLTRPGSKWTFVHSLEAFGRTGTLEKSHHTTPTRDGCGGADCLDRLQYQRGEVTEWYANTLQGVRMGFELPQRPDGDGPLVFRSRVRGLRATVADNGRSIVFANPRGELAVTLAPVLATDAWGRRLSTRVETAKGRVQLLVDDARANYPVSVEAVIGSCPPDWCDDGDPSTVDACAGIADGDYHCANPFDHAYEDRPCSQGEFCCEDRRFHAECGKARANSDCPNEWCHDGDPTTGDRCEEFAAGVGLFRCEYDANLAMLGKACTWGARCCGGIVASGCPVETTTRCPRDWCNDADTATTDTCTDYRADGTFTCSHVVKASAEGLLPHRKPGI